MDKNKVNAEDNLVASLVYKFLPFWPLFVVLFILSVAGAWAYLKFYATPTYAITASLIIRDEEKGVNASKITESIDAFSSNKIVENELNVLRSNALMNQVVNELKLYAPVYEETKLRSVPAYTSSPITITLKDPEKATENPMIFFTYDESSKEVIIDSKKYSIGTWEKTPYGVMLFSENEKQTSTTTNPLYFSIISPTRAANQLSGSIFIESAGKLSSVVNLYLEDKVPERGEDILNALIHAYQKAAVTEKNSLVSQTLAFVEERIQLIEKELQNLEDKIVKYKSTQGAVNLNEQGKLFLQSVDNNDRRLNEINLQLAVLDNVERYVVRKNKDLGIVPSTLGVSDPVLSQLLQKLYNSEIQYQQLSKTTAENNPLLVSLREEIESIRPGILENIRNQRDNLVSSRSKLSSTNSSYSSVLQSIPRKERELLEISRQQAIKNNAYSFLLQKREETMLSYAPTAEDIRVVDMAESSKTPVSPNALYVYLSAVVLALAGGVALVTGKEMLHSKVLFRSEIEAYLNAPIVAELSTVKNHDKNLPLQPAEVAQVEQFRQLRVTMGLYGRTFTRRKIMVTSSIPGEGKSFVSTNLAISLSSSGKKVVILDFDLRNPNTSVLFENANQTGIIEYLKDNLDPRDIIRSTSFDNLSMIPAGIDIGDHTELLLNSKMEELFSYLEESYDYVIIDTPPVDLVSDAYLLSEYCDISLLVIRHAYTPKSFIQRLSQNNKLRSMGNVAIVFNGVKPRGFVKGQYGYGYGYGYENKYGDKTYRARKLATKS
ncbi:tyrosine-protein kinase family protein [Pontibacter korlensis]|uniref:non-specific protein-tyrosine kinase n=1 Tax=Pontibacter korlensis TaxID=400092 RepID=A0A0E3ZGV6_9BACT|nr:tyrosine-protein kinase family protein [Pontibacter korlensis]AKD04408.1 capsular biosynthesis protein [Pontibacter korlensis]